MISNLSSVVNALIPHNPSPEIRYTGMQRTEVTLYYPFKSTSDLITVTGAYMLTNFYIVDHVITIS